MTDFEKAALLYLAVQAEYLHLIAWAVTPSHDAYARGRIRNTPKDLAKDLMKFLTPEMIDLLGAPKQGTTRT